MARRMKITNRRTIRSAQADSCFFVGETKKSARSCRHCPDFCFSMARLPLNTVGGSDNYGTGNSHLYIPPLLRSEKVTPNASEMTSVESIRYLPFESRQ